MKIQTGLTKPSQSMMTRSMTWLIKIHPAACLILFFLFLFVANWGVDLAPAHPSASRTALEYCIVDNAAVTGSLVMAVEFLALSFYNCRIPTPRKTRKR